MTDAPERIWAWELMDHYNNEPMGLGEWYTEDVGLDGDETEYLRTDIADALVAAAYVDALTIALDVADHGEYHGEASVDTASQIYRGGGQEVYDELKGRSPAHARAAYDKAIAAAIRDVKG